jgi:hypothetical protein
MLMGAMVLRPITDTDDLPKVVEAAAMAQIYPVRATPDGPPLPPGVAA